MERFEKTSKEMHIYCPVVNEDTISRQWLLECLTARGLKFDTEKDENIFIHLVRDIAPPTQPDRKIGKWVRNDNDTYSCNLCQSWIPEEQRRYARYCLYCGAIMKGNKNNGTD